MKNVEVKNVNLSSSLSLLLLLLLLLLLFVMLISLSYKSSCFFTFIEILEDCHYNRAITAHKAMVDSVTRLYWVQFKKWLK